MPLVKSSSVSWFMISRVNINPAGGPPDVLGVDVDVDRKDHLGGRIVEDDADHAPVRVLFDAAVLPLDLERPQRDVHVDGLVGLPVAIVGSLNRQGDGVAGRRPLIVSTWSLTNSTAVPSTATMMSLGWSDPSAAEPSTIDRMSAAGSLEGDLVAELGQRHEDRRLLGVDHHRGVLPPDVLRGHAGGLNPFPADEIDGGIELRRQVLDDVDPGDPST